MAKLSQKSRDRLVKIPKDERAEERCILVQGHMKEANELTADVDFEINAFEKQINKKQMEIQTYAGEKNKLTAAKDKLLKENNLLNFNTTYGTCNLGGKPLQLEAFDIKTRNMEKEILER